MKSTPKHIVHLMPYKAVGGTEMAALRIAQVARDAGYKNSFVTVEGFPIVSEFYRDNGFDVVELPEIEPSFRRVFPYFSASRKAARVFRELGVDLLHAQDYSAAFSNTLAAKIAGIPIVSHVRNKHDQVSKRDQIFLRGVNQWLFVSKESRKYFSYQPSDADSTVLYDGVKVAEVDSAAKRANKQSVFEEFGLSSDTKLIGMVARIAPQKDFFTLANAVKKVSESINTLKVLLIGDNSNEQSTRDHFVKVSQHIANLGTADKFIFTGYRSDVPRLIDSLDVHVLSTHFEGFALTNLEVMGQGIPAISTMSDSSMEITEHGKNGLLFEHENDDDLAEQLLRLINDHEFAEKIGKAGHETISKNFSHEIFSENLINFYKRILD